MKVKDHKMIGTFAYECCRKCRSYV